jgi:hypothetical protein
MLSARSAVWCTVRKYRSSLRSLSRGQDSKNQSCLCTFDRNPRRYVRTPTSSGSVGSVTSTVAYQVELHCENCALHNAFLLLYVTTCIPRHLLGFKLCAWYYDSNHHHISYEGSVCPPLPVVDYSLKIYSNDTK